MYSDRFLIFFNYFSAFFVVIPVVLGFISKIQKQKSLIFIFYLQCITFFIEIINSLLAYNNNNSMMIVNLFTLIEFFFILWFFKSFFDKFFRPFFHVFLFFFFLLFIIYTGFVSNDIKIIDNLSVSIESIILIIYSLFSFYIIMKKMIYENLLSTPFFWINSAILIYFSGNLFFFAFSNYLQKHSDQSLFLQLYIIHSIFNILYYITLSIGFWKARKV
jgi:hypothetical protein